MATTDGKRLANLVNCATDGTAAAPPISFGAGFNNNSGTGIYGDIASMNLSIAGSSVMALSASLCTLAVSLSLSNDVVLLTNAGAPTNGVTGAAVAGPGSICIDYTNANLYVNANTKVSPTWKLVTRAA
jgi:hypothetical protein